MICMTGRAERAKKCKDVSREVSLSPIYKLAFLAAITLHHSSCIRVSSTPPPELMVTSTGEQLESKYQCHELSSSDIFTSRMKPRKMNARGREEMYVSVLGQLHSVRSPQPSTFVLLLHKLDTCQTFSDRFIGINDRMCHWTNFELTNV